MSYFLREPFGSDLPQTYRQLTDLHAALHPRVRNHNLDIYPSWQKPSIISSQSAASLEPDNIPVLTYFRSREHAEMIERRMGRDVQTQVEPHRHPVIELRLTPETFSVELIVAPAAWWDQQNLVGKLELPHQRSAFRSLLRDLDPNYCFGFWDGTHLSDMHLTTSQLLKGRVLDEWMATFAEGQDWLRVGKWVDATNMNPTTMLAEAFDAVKALHPLYTYILWTSNNNFHSFYEKRERTMRRTYV